MLGPRNIAGPVVRGPDFWGRENEVKHLWQLLTQGSVLLTGPRRHGKSSLMYGALDQPSDGFVVILLDVEWIETPEEFLTTMAAELLAIDRVRQVFSNLGSAPSALRRWISSIIEDVGVGVSNVGELKIRLRQSLPDDDSWPELAGQMLATLRTLPQRVVLILDEFPIMISSMLQVDLATALRFLRWFRTFRQSPGTDRLTFLLGGSTNIEPRLESLGAEAVLGDLQRFRLMPFPGDKALNFVNELLRRETSAYEPGVPEAIYALCESGVPFYLQTIVAECIAEIHRSGKALSVSNVRSIYRERVVGPVNRHRFSHYQTRLRSYYSEFEEPARIVLARLCRGPEPVDNLRANLAAAGYDPQLLDQTLVFLEGDYYVLRDGIQIMFGDGLLRDWWARNSIPAKVKL